MSNGLANKIILGFEQMGAFVAGVILSRWIFSPLFVAILLWLFLRVAPMRPARLFMIAMDLMESIAICVSALVTGVIVSFFAIRRERRTTIFTSAVLTAWYLLDFVPIPFRVGLTGGTLAYQMVKDAVNAACLFGFALLGAQLIRKRRSPGPKQVIPTE